MHRFSRFQVWLDLFKAQYQSIKAIQDGQRFGRPEARENQHIWLIHSHCILTLTGNQIPCVAKS